MGNNGRFLGLELVVWSGIQSMVAVFGPVLAVASILWGIVEYRGKLEADRARETLGLLDVWETRGFLESYRALDEGIEAVLKHAPAADIAAAESDPAIRATLYAKAARTVLQSVEARRDFEAAIYFFERMHICVEANLCAPEATAQFFEDTLTSFAEVYQAPLKAFRNGPPSFLARQ